MNITRADHISSDGYVHVMKDGPVTNEVETKPSKNGS